MDYTWENLISREFEIIACNFADDMFPAYEWELTGNTRDDNHDFFTQTGIGEKWGEAKHSENSKKTMSRSQWDPTLISAKLLNSVNDILLVTCAHIPLSYIIRAFHMISSPIEHVYCINRYLLNEWYHKHQTNLSVFNSDFFIDSILSKLAVRNINVEYNNDIQLYTFNDIEKNYLTIVKNLINNCEYDINIAIFCTEDNDKVEIDLGPCILISSSINVVNMSFSDTSYVTSANGETHIECNIFKGYSVITFDIITSEINEREKNSYIRYSMGKTEKMEHFHLSKAEDVNDFPLVELEKKIRNNKRIFNSNYIPPHLLKRPNYRLFYIHFDCRGRNNYIQLCRMFSHFLTGIDFQELDEQTVKHTLFLGNYPVWLENLILGVFGNVVFQNIKLEYLQQYVIDNSNTLTKKVIYIAENVSNLDNQGKIFIKTFENIVSTTNNDNILIYQESNDVSIQNINDEIALVSIFETGIISKNLNNDDIKNNDLVMIDIDKTIYYPSNNIQFDNIFTYFLSKSEELQYRFLDRIISISSNQVWTSRVLDFITLLGGKVSNERYFKYIRSLRDICYNRTDFFSAYNYSILLYQDDNIDEKQKIDDMYKEADELNHCGSIIKSKIVFEKVANLALKTNDETILKKGIEALTEVYNIRFWLLDVNDLEAEINKTINEYFINQKVETMRGRELYPYYNCLNRKMVVQYLLNQYEEAEITFQEILTKIVLDNYIAFAYMDSARGLYNKDIYSAYDRIKIAANYLEKLFISGNEIRRYYDCLIEKAYIEFIIEKNENKKLKIEHLKSAIYDAQKYGYTSIVEKSYFKLAASYLVLGDLEKAKEYLDKIANNTYFEELPRNQLMYNELMKGYYHISNVSFSNKLTLSSDFCGVMCCLNFKCFDKGTGDTFYIDTRMW